VNLDTCASKERPGERAAGGRGAGRGGAGRGRAGAAMAPIKHVLDVVAAPCRTAPPPSPPISTDQLLSSAGHCLRSALSAPPITTLARFVAIFIRVIGFNRSSPSICVAPRCLDLLAWEKLLLANATRFAPFF